MYKIIETVEKVLENNIDARDDDFILIAEVYDSLRPELVAVPLEYALRNHKAYKLPSFESITRCRRKLQRDYEHLRASKAITAIRADQEQKYREFAKE